MKELSLLTLIGEARDKYVLEAAQTRSRKKSHLRLSRLGLIAAIVAMALLLAGCAAVIVMTLQDRKVGEITYDQKFDAYGNTVPVTEKTLNIASMSGFQDSPTVLAAQEWLEFTQSYDPGELGNDPDLPGIPNNYEYTYRCYTQAMIDKLDEIAQKYDLKIMGTRAVAQRWQREAAFQEMGIETLFRPDAPATTEYGALRVYPPFNFICDAFLTLTGEDAPWTENVLADIYYLKSGYLMPDATFVYDPTQCQEWTYTTADGTQVQLALFGTEGIILAQQADATIAIKLNLNWQSVFLEEGAELPTPAALERLADCFTYSITTQAVAEEGLQAKFDAIPDPSSLPPEDYEEPTYASFAEYLNANYGWPQLMQYAFYDIDGDGEKDLITSYGDGFCYDWLGIRDGKVMSLAGGRGSMRLCEGGIAEAHDETSGDWHLYMKIVGQHPVTGTKMEIDHAVQLREGVWEIDDVECTEAEASALMASYKPLTLDWQPLVNFPMDGQGTTFGDILEAEGTLSGDALKKFYWENYPHDFGDGEFTLFDLRDVNADGVDDLLLSIDGEKIDYLGTYNRGELAYINGDNYLCQGNVFETVNQSQDMVNGISEVHCYSKSEGLHWTFYDRLIHFISNNTWRDINWTLIPEEEALAIQAQHPRVDIPWKKIGDLNPG